MEPNGDHSGLKKAIRVLSVGPFEHERSQPDMRWPVYLALSGKREFMLEGGCLARLIQAYDRQNPNIRGLLIGLGESMPVLKRPVLWACRCYHQV